MEQTLQYLENTANCYAVVFFGKVDTDGKPKLERTCFEKCRSIFLQCRLNMVESAFEKLTTQRSRSSFDQVHTTIIHETF